MIEWDKYFAAQDFSQPEKDLAEMTADELAAEGERTLMLHLLDSALAARARFGELTYANLTNLLEDTNLVRFPVRLVFEYGEMAFHQFAQPEPDYRNPGGGLILYLRPALAERADLVPFAVAYMIPVINYGEDLIRDEHCLAYGAALFGLSEDAYYERICEVADYAGAEERARHNGVTSGFADFPCGTCDCGGE
ncbi:hypothetical protein HZA57_09930 [Candidatus Poribacteria bacterium]|nr:hypothetical protein [Candidatus Poribacteria bacterium]